MNPSDFNFGPNMQDFGRDMLRELIMTDYGPGCTFNGIDGHGLESHHGGLHDQTVIFQPGIKDSGMVFRFFQE